MKKETTNTMDKIISLCKRRGFVFPGSEIYGGLANSWDYGPLGVELKNNIKQLWWKHFVKMRDDMVGIDAALIMNPKVWENSGHVATFSDPLVECNKCHQRFRADKLVESKNDYTAVEKELNIKAKPILEEYIKIHKEKLPPIESGIDSAKKLIQVKDSISDQKQKDAILEIIKQIIEENEVRLRELKESAKLGEFVSNELKNSPKYVGVVAQEYFNRYISCSNCGAKEEWGIPKQFNLMLKTFLGPVEDEKAVVYFRPETAQAMFVDFKNVQETSRKKLPFGIAQIGKAFRNEITPGNFIFRTREFEQMEIEYFIAPPKTEKEWEEVFEYWRNQMHSWMKNVLGLKKIHELEVAKEDLAHYSKRTIDFEYDFPFGRSELYGLAYRTDFDLKNHFKDGAPYLDQETNEKLYPHVIEPTFGVDRSVLAVLCDAYQEEDERVVLKLKPNLAPYQVAVFPLLKNKPELVARAREIYQDLKQGFMVAWDDRGNIGKRYYSQDEIGTPFCVTVDFDTLEKGEVTVRDRDSMKQEKVKVEDLKKYIYEHISKN